MFTSGTEAKRDGEINQQNYYFNQIKWISSTNLFVLFKRYEQTEVEHGYMCHRNPQSVNDTHQEVEI